ncbi:hypothetical protein [Azospirillum doebereinerae]|uniref:Uncharacterized protein n=1 Tax=Azospirillum doebereinerae TaxID=92933 RepID=A0A3S1CHF8_9PROT|nr:hypothetical protein [Azospirillum doebereinerae]MCG5238751.1 hypothetical protein [Azospirillum doebereinerae]RUQ72069.1 hypothetical protein EJ913_10890 [Azospirillum doebereinerae]
MFELVLVVCLMSNPEECSIERPAFSSKFSNVMSCTRNGYVSAVQWEMDHPNWRVRRWRCQQPET